MKPIRYTLKFATALCIALGVLVLAWLIQPKPAQPAAVQSGGGMALQPPAFLKSAQAAGLAQVDFGFLLEEAGVTAYTKLDQELDLENLASRFKTIGQQTDQFVNGIMIAPGYEKLLEFGESAEVQVFLHRDGWIVAYMTRYQTASVIFDWVNYDGKRLENNTLIENVVRSFALDMGVSDFTVAYYDFRNPEATNLMLVADRADDIRMTESFEINIPRELTVNESSWSYAQFDSVQDGCNSCPAKLGSCILNDNDEMLPPYFAGFKRWNFAARELNKTRFALGKNHTFRFTGYGVRAYCGLAIVYREATK